MQNVKTSARPIPAHKRECFGEPNHGVFSGRGAPTERSNHDCADSAPCTSTGRSRRIPVKCKYQNCGAPRSGASYWSADFAKQKIHPPFSFFFFFFFFFF